MVSFSVLVYIFKDSELLNVIAPSRMDPAWRPVLLRRTHLIYSSRWNQFLAFNSLAASIYALSKGIL
jgi:hypothetical protein